LIELKTEKEIDKLGEIGKIASAILKRVAKEVRPCISTKFLNDMVEKLVAEYGVKAAFKGYHDYPASICVSVNEEVVHGIPDAGKILEEGDIVSLDFGAMKGGYYSDLAVTVGVGKINAEDERLINVTREALYKGIDKARAGNRLFDISYAVQRHVESSGYSVVRAFVGHGIGKALHEEPQVPNFGNPGCGAKLKEGMVLAIEPMVNAGSYDVRVKNDGWTAVAADGGRSAHFEHCVAITRHGPMILTEEGD
jgi:methionyl aminopeptidase